MMRLNRVPAGRVVLAALLLLGVSGAAQAQPAFTKQFTPDTIGPGSVTRLRFDITNGSGAPVMALAFTDTLPAGVTLATPAAMTSTCGGTATAPSGGGTISLSGGDLSGSIDVHGRGRRHKFGSRHSHEPQWRPDLECGEQRDGDR